MKSGTKRLTNSFSNIRYCLLVTFCIDICIFIFTQPHCLRVQMVSRALDKLIFCCTNVRANIERRVLDSTISSNKLIPCFISNLYLIYCLQGETTHCLVRKIIFSSHASFKFNFRIKSSYHSFPKLSREYLIWKKHCFGRAIRNSVSSNAEISDTEWSSNRQSHNNACQRVQHIQHYLVAGNKIPFHPFLWEPVLMLRTYVYPCRDTIV